MRKILPVLVLGIAVLGFLALKANRPKALPVAPAEKEWPVSVELVKRQSLSPAIQLYGRVESPREAQLSSAVTADVVEVLTLEGELVSQGAVLAHLDDHDVRNVIAQHDAELADLRAQIKSEDQRYASDMEALKFENRMLSLANRSLERARKLADTKVGTQSGVDDASNRLQQNALAVSNRKRSIADHDARKAQLEARLKRAQVLRDQAERDLERTLIKAPFDGRVTNVKVSPGNRVRSGDVLIEMFDTALLEIRVQIPTRQLVAVRNGWQSSEEISGVATLDGRLIPVMLQRLGGRVEQGGVVAFFRLKNDNTKLELGRTLALEIDLPEVNDVISVPYEAVYGNDVVYKIVEGRLVSVMVERMGELSNERLLVRNDGLKEGDQIVVSQLPGAVEGLRVKPVSP